MLPTFNVMKEAKNHERRNQWLLPIRATIYQNWWLRLSLKFYIVELNLIVGMQETKRYVCLYRVRRNKLPISSGCHRTCSNEG